MHTKKQMSRKKKLNKYPIGRGLLSLMIMMQMIPPIYYRAYGQARQGLFRSLFVSSISRDSSSISVWRASIERRFLLIAI